MRRALAEYEVGGIKTTIPFFREVMHDEEFVSGRLDTGFIARFMERRRAGADTVGEEEARGRDLARIAAVLGYTEGASAAAASQRQTPAPAPSRWKTAGRAALHGSRIRG
jgi:acetyl/propionyl-CoA carboxylase alpha subunit